ncbi:hypothetical protein NDU88_006891, partial [Pleurodeles waltl]
MGPLGRRACPKRSSAFSALKNLKRLIAGKPLTRSGNKHRCALAERRFANERASAICPN